MQRIRSGKVLLSFAPALKLVGEAGVSRYDFGQFIKRGLLTVAFQDTGGNRWFEQSELLKVRDRLLKETDWSEIQADEPHAVA